MEAFARALEPHLGKKLSEADIMARRPRAERRFLRELAGPDRARACLDAFYLYYQTLHPTHFQGIYPGVLSLLTELREAEVPIGVVSGKSRRSWKITSGYVNLGPFQAEVLDDDVPCQKPDPAGVLQGAAALETPPEEVLYVGDSLTDLDAARAGGLQSAAVLWCKKPEEVDEFRREARGLGAELFSHPEGLIEHPAAQSPASPGPLTPPSRSEPSTSPRGSPPDPPRW